MVIYHILSRADWEAALAAGQYAPPSLAREGFIHASTFEQVADTANRFYRGQTGLVLLCIDAVRVHAEVRYDAVDLAGKQAFFPHIYGPLNLDAVGRVVAFPPEPDGTFRMPAEFFDRD